MDLACSESYEADFKYIKPKQGLMSELVKRAVREELHAGWIEIAYNPLDLKD